MTRITEDELRAALVEEAEPLPWATDEGWDEIRRAGRRQSHRRRSYTTAIAATVAAAAAIAGAVLVTGGDSETPVPQVADTTVPPAPGAGDCSATGRDVDTTSWPDEQPYTTARAILAAAIACDYGALGDLMATDFVYGFGSTYGPEVTIDNWRDQEADGQGVLAQVADAFVSEPFCTDFGCQWANLDVGMGVDISPDGEWRGFDGSGDDPNASECQTASLNGPAVVEDPAMPDAVRVTAHELYNIAMSCDYDTLRRKMPDDFTHSFGDERDPDRAIAAWQEADDEIFQLIVDMLTTGTVDVEAGDIWRWSDPDNELGFRIGINTDGEWVYAVAGD